MQSRYLVTGLVIVLAAVTGVLIYRGDQSDTVGSSTVIVTVTTTAVPEPSVADPYTRDTQGATQTGAVETGDRPPTNVPMTRLAPGEKAPQFIIFSFDGAGSHQRWNEFMAAADETNSRFTGFLSGIYLIGASGRAAGVYTGPGHKKGEAAIGYGDPEDVIITEVNDLNMAYSKGHEIGTHYNGHFCSNKPPGGDQWSAADWEDELDQFFLFLTDWKELNGYTDAPDLNVPPEAVKGGRTPCLEGNWDDLVPAWKAHNLTYDSSIPAPYSGIGWPEKKDGIWEFHMPAVYSPGFGSTVTAMDYNFWFKFNQGREQPETAPELRGIVKQTYEYMYDQAYNGNRAPVLIANHFNKWNGDSFNPPALDFMREKCGQPDTYCATYQDVIAWMEMQDPEVLAQLQAQAPVAGTAP